MQKYFIKILPGSVGKLQTLVNMNHQIKTIIAFTAIYFVWGSTFFGVAMALKSFPPFLMSALRFLIGGLSLATFCIYKREALPGKKEIIKFSLWGIVIFGGGVISVVWAQQYLPSALTSIIISTPFWFVILDKSQWRINFKNGWIMGGIIAGLAGVIVLLSQRPSTNFGSIAHVQMKAMLVIIAGSLLWVVGSLQLRNKQSSISVYMKTSIHLIAAAAFALIISLLSGEFKMMQWQLISPGAVLALLYLSIISTTVTFLAFIWLIKHKPVALVSTYAYINPMVAVLLGVFIGGEAISVIQIAAMLIILSGVLFINIPNYKHKVLGK